MAGGIKRAGLWVLAIISAGAAGAFVPWITGAFVASAKWIGNGVVALVLGWVVVVPALLLGAVGGGAATWLLRARRERRRAVRPVFSAQLRNMPPGEPYSHSVVVSVRLVGSRYVELGGRVDLQMGVSTPGGLWQRSMSTSALLPDPDHQHESGDAVLVAETPMSQTDFDRLNAAYTLAEPPVLFVTGVRIHTHLGVIEALGDQPHPFLWGPWKGR